MRVLVICLIAMLLQALATGASADASALSVPSLGAFSIPGFPAMLQGQQLVPPQEPATVPAEVASGPFTLSISGNIYFDKLPVQGAEVAIYVNGRQRAKTVAGDIYMFKVPGVNMGDTVTVEAKYEGYTGVAAEKVKFKNMYTNVYIKSDRSFIRSALDMLPSQEDLDKAQQARQSQGQQQQQQQQPAASSGSGSQGSTADASQLSSDIFKSAFGSMGNTAGQTVNAIGNMKPPSAPGFDGRVTTLEDAMKAAGGF